jgi:hypothetical protein
MSAEPTGNEWSQPKGDATWAANGKDIGLGLPKPIELRSCHSMAGMLDMELQDLMFSLQVFCLDLLQSFFTILLFICFGMRIFILCHCILEVCNFVVLQGLTVRVCLESQKRLWT